MAKKIKIGIIYSYDENWIGGSYYIQNLIDALSFTLDKSRYQIVILTWDRGTFEKLQATSKLKQLDGRSFMRQNILIRITNKISRAVTGKNLLSIYHQDLDVVFPARSEQDFKPDQRFLYWIPDFQDHHLPEFFLEEDKRKRKAEQVKVVQQAKYIVFSSESAKKDFNEIYPGNTLKQFVLQFATTHPVPTASFTDLVQKYKLNEKYFICSNQFWKHKNHQLVLKAINVLKQQGLNIQVVFTGKESDYRNPDFFESLKELITKLNVAENVKFLGFISREDQILLMKNSVAVIQPSLFEGWSTVVEDVKSMSNTIIASNIDVHKEQLANYDLKYFFSVDDELELANVLSKVWQLPDGYKINFNYDYKKDVLQFGNTFVNIINDIVA